ncbi:MAG: ATP-binding protein [Syntrophales bacterium]
MNRHKILFVSDEQPLCRTIGWALEYKGYLVRSAATPEAAIEALVKKNFDLIIAKLAREDMGTLDVLNRAKKLNPAVKVMVIEADQHMTFPPEAYRIEMDDYLLLPISPTELWRRVSRCLEKVVDPEAVDLPAYAPATHLNDPVSNRVLLMMHDIRGSIVSIAASLKLLVRGYHGETSPQAAKRLQESYDKVLNLAELVEEFMQEILSPDRGPDSKEEILDLRQDLIAPVLQEFAPELRDHQININNRLDAFPADLIPIKGDKPALKSIFRNLLANAIKYGGQRSCIMIGLEKQGSDYRLNVYNTGKPIPEEYHPILFSGHSYLHRNSQDDREGMGLGLYLSRRIIKNHGGDMLYEAKADGSNFVVSLPRS